MGDFCSGWIGQLEHRLVALDRSDHRLGSSPATFCGSHPGLRPKSGPAADWANCIRRHDDGKLECNSRERVGKTSSGVRGAFRYGDGRLEGLITGY